MDTEKIERLRERLLHCAVCMDEFKDPRILPCHHTLCYECIASVIQSSSTSGRFFRCPHCRSDICVPRGGIADLPINFYIISLQDELGTSGYTGTCDICERDWLNSQFRCIDCDFDICRFCIHAHRLETHAESPKILRIETSPSNIQLASNRVCHEHADEILQMFCSTCSQAICVTCSCSQHSRHKVVPLSVKLVESKSYLQSELDRLTSEKRKAMQAESSLKKDKDEIVVVSNRSLLALDEAANRACEMIMKKKSEIEKEILRSERRQVEKIEDCLNDFQMYQQRIERGLSFLSDLQDNDICLEVVDTYKDFSSKLSDARKLSTSHQLRLGHCIFSPLENGHVVDINLGVCRKLYYHGGIGTLSERKFFVSVDPNTFGIRRGRRGLSHVLESVYFWRCFQFLFAFLIFQILLYLGDVSGVFEMMQEFVMSIYTGFVLFVSSFF